MAEKQLYHSLLEERKKLASSLGTAPYAICGDQAIKRIALTRPSTRARLANIDGVNQVSYAHIEVFLTMEKCGISLDGAQPNHQNAEKSDRLVKNETELSPSFIDPSHVENPHRVKTSGQDSDAYSLDKISETDSLPVIGEQDFQLAEDPFVDLISKKRQKLGSPKEDSDTMKATEKSILDWLNTKKGVTLLEILEHFKGSEEESVIEFLASLESEFEIYKKNNMYFVMQLHTSCVCDETDFMKITEVVQKLLVNDD